MEAVSIQKFLKVSPRKVRLVVASVKKMKPGEAIEVLPHLNQAGALPMYKAVKSAIANAQVKGIPAKSLVFKEIQINEGPRLKRWRAGARGRAKPYERRMSHIRVVVSGEEKK